jgi:hypothetical protein
MVDLISSHPIGVFIVKEENGQIAANTPGGIDLANLTVGDTYIYYTKVLRFEHKLTANYESDTEMGHKTQGVGNGKRGHTTGTSDQRYFLIIVETDEDGAEQAEQFLVKNNQTGSYATSANRRYLCKQTATTVFRQLPNATGAFKNYAPVILRGVSSVEKSDSGKDVQLVTLALEEVQIV